MFTVHLNREVSGPDGTFGNLVLPTGIQLVTGELPWRDNRPGASCIPVGKYKAVWSFSPKFKGYYYRLLEVPQRAGILIHPANYCGLASDGKKQELLGCIALGKGTAYHGTQRILTSSRAALAQFVGSLNRQPFYLEIKKNDS